ncbi:MAG: 3-hydroxylacyl-ACP dehydratase [Methylococcaceae bacterium]|nr:3-hydroxylacyl-ACP dehydratase [Methylococcaceae bacterium]
MIDIEMIMPHAGIMVLLDKVLSYDQQSMVVKTTVRNDGLFGNEQTIPAWLGIEYMAQTVAAHGGMMCYLAGKPINVGFLVGTRRYNCNIATFKVGTILTISVERVMGDQGLCVFFCQVVGEGIDISAKLNVYLPGEKNHAIN